MTDIYHIDEKYICNDIYSVCLVILSVGNIHVLFHGLGWMDQYIYRAMRFMVQVIYNHI